MAWRFEPGEDLAEAFRRVAGEEIAKIRAALSSDQADHAKAIHEARQGFKRLRALARLGKPALGSAFARENERWRDAGRLLAGSRDETVLLQSFDKLVAGCRAALPSGGIARLRAKIAGPGDRTGSPRAREDVEGVLQRLDSAAADVAALDWPDSKSALARGLRKGQSGLRKAWKLARKGEEPHALHAWRKRVKDQAAQLRLLRRVTPAKYRARRNEEKEVAELLGDEHDLWLLGEWLRARAHPAGARPLRDILLAEIEERRRGLREQAFKKGLGFSSESAESFAAALSGAWESASKRKTRKQRRKSGRPTQRIAVV